MSERQGDVGPRGEFRPGMRRGGHRVTRIEKARGFVVVYTSLNLLGPYLLGVAIDRYILGRDLPGLLRIAILMLGVYLLSAAFQAAEGVVIARISQRILQKLRDDLFRHFQRLSLRFFDRHPVGELMSRLTNDIEAINNAVSQNVTTLVTSVLTLIGILGVMFALNFWLALTALVVAPLMFAFTSFVARYTRRGYRRLQRQLGRLNGVIEETISGQRVVVAYRQNQRAMDDFGEANQEVYKAGVYAQSYALLLMPLTHVLGNFFIILLAGLGGWLALRELATIGMIATFISYGQRFIHPVRQLANMYNIIQAALAGAERVFEILDTPPDLVDDPEAQPLEVIRGACRKAR